MKKFFDANVFVYAYTASPLKGEARSQLQHGGQTDALALAEAFAVIKHITKSHAYAQKTVRRIMAQCEVVPVTQSDVFNATKIRYLRMNDAIHLVCSQGCELVTYDKDFEKHK